MANILKVKDIDLNLLVLTIGSFDFEIYNIIKDHKNLENLSIQFFNIPTHARHRLHTFERKNWNIIYSVGDIIDKKRSMIIELTKEYIEYLFKNCKLNSKINKNDEIQKLLEIEFSKFKIDIMEKIKIILNKI